MTLKELVAKCYECGYDNGTYEARQDYFDDEPMTLQELIAEIEAQDIRVTVGGY